MQVVSPFPKNSPESSPDTLKILWKSLARYGSSWSPWTHGLLRYGHVALSLSLSLSYCIYIYIYTDIYRHILEAHHTFKLQTGRYGQLMDSSANESVTSRDASTLLQDQYDKSCWLLWDVGTHYLDMLGDYIWRSNLLGYIILSIEQTIWDETSPAWTHHGAHSQGRKIPSSLAFRQIRTQTHTTERRATMVLSTIWPWHSRG